MPNIIVDRYVASKRADLSADELAVLDDWADRFENKKLYPVVGLLPTFPAES